MSACCGTCIYWGKDEKLGENAGMCRRYPPEVLLVQTTPAGNTTVQSHFPPTMGFGWCGEFVEKPVSPPN